MMHFKPWNFTELVYRHASSSFYKVEQVSWVPDSFPEEYSFQKDVLIFKENDFSGAKYCLWVWAYVEKWDKNMEKKQSLSSEPIHLQRNMTVW